MVPLRLAGRKPKCFFGLLKSFLGTSLMGFPAEAQHVHLLLESNPAFARVCGFSLKAKDRSDYHYHRLIEAYHPTQPTPPGQLAPELAFGRNLIGFDQRQAERLQIANIQTSLFKLGYNIGKIDGKLGPKTTGAIKAFQKKQTLKVDGKVTRNLQEQLKLALDRTTLPDPSLPDHEAQQ